MLQGQGWDDRGPRESALMLAAGRDSDLWSARRGDPNLALLLPPISCWGCPQAEPTGSHRAEEPIYQSIRVSKLEKDRAWDGGANGRHRSQGYGVPIFTDAVLPVEASGDKGVLCVCVPGGEGVVWERHLLVSQLAPSPSSHST